MIDLSIVVAVYNEEEVLNELHRRLTNALVALGSTYEILLIDDGSRDRSLAIMREIEAQDPEHVRIFSFTRNFGHHIALTAGLDHAQGAVVVMMDADLQDQPEELHKLLAKLDEGYDVVWGDREERQFKWYKNLSSQLFIWTMNSVVRSEVPLNSSIYRAMRKEVADDLRQLREKARFLPGLVSWLGYRQTSTPVVHGKRFAGETKYSFWRLIKLALSTATSFSAAPLQLATIVGMGTAVLALLCLLYIVIRKIMGGYQVLGYASLMFAILFFGALQLIVIGLLGEYISRIYSEAQGRPLYLLKDLKSGGRLRKHPEVASLPAPTNEVSARKLSQLTESERNSLKALAASDGNHQLARVYAELSSEAHGAYQFEQWLRSDPYVFFVSEGDIASSAILFQKLEWDSKQLGIPSGRILHVCSSSTAVDSRRAEEIALLVHQVRAFAQSQGICFIDARVSNQDLFLMRAFEEAGFHTVDLLVTLGADLTKMQRAVGESGLVHREDGALQFPNGLVVRAMQPNEVDLLADLSYRAFGDGAMIQDRFFLEPEIDHERAAELFREWFYNLARKHDAGDGIVLVAEDNGKPLGYVGIEHQTGPDGKLLAKDSLNAVMEEARGRGVYKALIHGALYYAAGQNASVLITKTQSSTYRVINTWLHMGCDLYENFATLHWIDSPNRP